MPTTDFHPDLRAARYLPRSAVGPRRLRLIRWLLGLQKPDPSANAVVAEAGPRVPVRVFRPATLTGRRPGLLWLHGGGMVLNTITVEDEALNGSASERNAS